ncbi:uncharacterized protein RHIMIDRAFT_233861 [Rhizopus microsporus ATCC 52813]|uniref:RNA-binding protein 48 n=1 Tax=Rhizopus microsporus ATCC 52813 TaxID=1340429 RepID=A0A2G4T5H0_RHIZD|nr:uncharacterized protein RHIMIDRAFT_233861 [Rhizopus microsporus ATCC 52813]PHZ16260.1 hypothetical protein RHIMIDRAFT_233861 [Rhizopus microsporus ATCC 52813]
MHKPDYREPKTAKTTCVYTISQESRYLIIENIPSLGVINELIKLCQQYGDIEEYKPLDHYPTSTAETDVVWIKYMNIASARMAKRKLDEKPFFAHMLKVNYAPECESFEDIRSKFNDRITSISKKLNHTFHNRKRKRQSKDQDAVTITVDTNEDASHKEPQAKARRRI